MYISPLFTNPPPLFELFSEFKSVGGPTLSAPLFSSVFARDEFLEVLDVRVAAAMTGAARARRFKARVAECSGDILSLCCRYAS